MKSITSSVVIAQALGITPDGVPAKADGICALCGLDIAPGDLCAPLSLGDGFMDDVSMAGRGSKVICGHCAPMMTADALRQTGYGAFSIVSGAHPFRKWADVAKMLTNPPDAPFVMVYATANNQHMAWRAPVNLSRDLFYVRVGLRDLKIRRKILVEAVEHCRFLGDALYAGKKSTGARKTLPNPFIEMAPDLKDASHGLFHPKVYSEEMRASVDGFVKHMQAVMSLTVGEVWALRFVLTPGAGQAESE